jgi:HSP20 family protein
MAKLMKREGPFEDLFDFRQSLDDLFNRMVTRSPWLGERMAELRPEVPPIEAWMDKDGMKYHLRVSLPGIEPQNVQLNVQGNTLSIHGERKESHESKDAQFLRREISYGTIDRTLTLPEGVEVDKLTAEFSNGLLEISAPVAAAALPRRIEVKTPAKSKSAGA